MFRNQDLSLPNVRMSATLSPEQTAQALPYPMLAEYIKAEENRLKPVLKTLDLKVE